VLRQGRAIKVLAFRAEQPALFASAILPAAVKLEHWQGRTYLVDHTVSVGMDADTLKQLDDLRRAHPNVPSRVEIIKRLIWEAHAKIAAPVTVGAEG
jgi:hypothetical protein